MNKFKVIEKMLTQPPLMVVPHDSKSDLPLDVVLSNMVCTLLSKRIIQYNFSEKISFISIYKNTQYNCNPG